jgi:hypothetical protein
VLHERAVPHDTEKEGADEDGQHEHEKLHERVRASLGLGYFLNHLLDVDIFFLQPLQMKDLPLSGSESKFTNRRWGSQKGIGNNNCYAYAVGDYEAYRWQKSIPGDRSGLSNGNHSYTHCTGLPKRVISDNPTRVYKTGANEKCKKGYYKVMMFVSPGRPSNYIRQGDFHFYKQHGVVEYKIKPGDTVTSTAKFFKVPESRVKRAGPFKVGKRIVFKANVFSHKRGWATGPLLTDAKGNSIRDPRKASRNYPGLNYERYCSSFCVKNTGIKVGKTHPEVRKNTV